MTSPASQDCTDGNRMILMDEKGRCVMVTEDLKLCAVDRQENESWVQIKERTHEKNILLAILFLYNGRQYYAKVDGNNVVLEKADCCQVSESIWFMKVQSGSGNHYGLRSMVGQKKYLSYSENRPRNILLGEMNRFFSLQQA